MSDNNKFLKGTLILAVSSVVVKVIGSLNWIILSRVLGGEGIGLYQMGFPIYLMAITVSSAGIPVAISIITAEKLANKDYRGAKRVFSVSLRLLLISGLVFSSALFFGAGWLIENQYIRDARAYYSIIALAPAVFFVTFLASFRGYLQGWQIMTPTAVSEVVEQLMRVITMLVFADMFLPSVIGSSIESEMTRFVVAATSVTQLIYMSEIGSIIMGSKIPVSLKDLFIIFLERTIVTLPVIALFAHLLF